MKQFYFFLFKAFRIFKADAQLTTAIHAPVAGELYQRYQCDSTGIQPGPAGANVLWNFSVATRSSVNHSYTAAVSSNFQPATVSLESDKSREDHYRISPVTLQDFSSSFLLATSYYVNLNYISPSVKARYPMSLNTTSTAATSGFISAIMIIPQAGTFIGTCTTLADGTGTLILPGITYTKVIRVVNTKAISFAMSYNGTIVLKNYEFYADGVKQPVFSIFTATLTIAAANVRRTLVTRLKHAVPAAPLNLMPENDKLVCENMSTTLSVSETGTVE